MERVETEEKHSRCYQCTAGLSYLENYFFGNRCVFCTDKVQNVPLRPFLRLAKLDWKIYQALIILRNKKGEDGILIFRAILGSLGYQDLNDVKTLTMRKEILRELWKVNRKD